MHQQIVSTVIIIHHQDKFLLVKRDPKDDIFPGKWQSVGGKMEPGETLEQTAKREVAEEVGILISSDLQFVMSYFWKKAEGEVSRLGVIFMVEAPEIKCGEIKLNEELCDFGWFTLEEATKLDTIGQDSPTGTMGQLKKAAVITNDGISTSKLHSRGIDLRLGGC